MLDQLRKKTPGRDAEGATEVPLAPDRINGASVRSTSGRAIASRKVDSLLGGDQRRSQRKPWALGVRKNPFLDGTPNSTALPSFRAG